MDSMRHVTPLAVFLGAGVVMLLAWQSPALRPFVALLVVIILVGLVLSHYEAIIGQLKALGAPIGRS